jgi:hypothetical protein
MPITIPLSYRIDFADESGPGVTSWLWEVGDGTTYTTQNPSHTYLAAGVYLVRLTVNGVATVTDTVTVLATGDPVAYTVPDPAYGEAVGGDPRVMLRLSNDGGKTWVCEMQRRAGRSGEYWRRVRWDRLGQARRRVFEVSVTDPIPWRLVGAYVKMTPEGRA